MSRTFFLLFLVLGQSQLGFGQDEDAQEDDNYARSPPSFKAVSSLFFQPGTDYNVFFTVNPHPRNETLQLKCILVADLNHNLTIQSESIFLHPGESDVVTIRLPREMPGSETTWRLFAWSVTEDSGPNGYTQEAPHTLIFSSRANPDRQSQTKVDLASVFIQTDKPAYKPDDLVRIRVITMGSNDLPHLRAGVNLTITDNHGNIMKKWEQPIELPETTPSNVSTDRNGGVALFGEFQKKTNGLSAYEFQLSSEPILGNWTIKVEAESIKEKMYFDVKKYILPKFKVKIHVPPVLFGTGDITTAATIKVSYTYGKDLQGSGNLTVTSDNNAAPKLQQIVVKDGEAIVPLTLSSPRAYGPTVHTITANISEKNTGRWQIGRATIRIYPKETSFITWINKPSSFKPGLPMTVQLKITGQDGFPVRDARAKALEIYFPHSSSLPLTSTSVPLSGIVKFTLSAPQESNHKSFRVQYKNTIVDFTLPPAANGTSSGIFIDVIPPLDSVQLLQGHSYNFTIKSNKPIKPEVFHCLLWDDAAMEVLGAQLIKNINAEDATEFPFSLQLPKAAYANLKVFVYFDNGENGNSEIISASQSIYTNNYLNIRVSRAIPIEVPTPASEIEQADSFPDSALPEAQPEPQPLLSDKLEVQPGDPVEIHFETYPDSTVAIRGIDQSLLLLTEQDNDLNPEKIKEKRESAEQSRKSQLDNIPTDSSGFLKTFRRLGISVLNSEKFNPSVGAGGVSSAGSVTESEIAPENSVLPDSRIPEVDSRLRTKFPETWLWEEFQSRNDSSITILSKTLPDTLTSWIISGFSLNPKTGLGAASPATITGFMPFFATLNLPYSVTKYESFDLQVIVHNYLDRDVNVWVTLFNKDKKFSFVDDREKRNGNATRYINVVKNHVAVAHFVITPLVIGDIPIEVKAVTEDGTAGDSMIRPLKVKPDGVRKTRSQLVLFEPKTGDKNEIQEKNFAVEFPKKQIVKGASSLQMTVIGDPMGTMTSNLGYVLQLPSGCGEQNMAKLVPNILALHYLSATNSDDKTTIKTAKSNLETGYGNQLLYQLTDGSFSIYSTNTEAEYRNSYAKGTVWLTSLVLRWFVVAQHYITIDPNVIKSAIDFIRSKQQKDGSFAETGTFYHPEMRGRSGANGAALSAYVTLALIKANETSNNDLNLKVAIENGMRFISQDSVYQLDDSYITNLVTATLMAGDHPEKTRFFAKMEKEANTNTTQQGIKVKYWGMKSSKERASDPLAIEMTSYALLAHLWKQGNMDNSALSIQKWLIKQRNPKGGFISTQDTTMGLTALTEFALKTIANVRNEDELQLKIQPSSNSSSVKDTEFSVPVIRANRMVLQEFTLPISTKSVKLHARGNGPALIQMTETWHVTLKTGPTTDDFNITATMTIPDQEEPSDTELKVCINSFKASGSKDSIASIQLPSGYFFEQEDYEDGSNFMASRPINVQKFELSEGNGKMDVYYTEIQAHPPTCTSFAATRINIIADPRRPPIHVYEYLDPDVKATIAYTPAHTMNVCQLCAATGGCHKQDCA